MNFIPNEGIPIVDRSSGSRSVHTAEQADGSSVPITTVLERAPCNFFIFSAIIETAKYYHGHR